MLLQVRSANSTVNLAAVRLDSMRVGKNLILSWPTNVIGFKLESTLALTNSVWSELATAPLIVGDRYTVTNRITEEARFYRLRWP